VPALIEALKDDNPNFRLFVIRALGKLGDDRALPNLKKLVNDTTENTVGKTTTVGEAAKEAIKAIETKKETP